MLYACLKMTGLYKLRLFHSFPMKNVNNILKYLRCHTEKKYNHKLSTKKTGWQNCVMVITCILDEFYPFITRFMGNNRVTSLSNETFAKNLNLRYLYVLKGTITGGTALCLSPHIIHGSISAVAFFLSFCFLLLCFRLCFFFSLFA